MTSSRWPFSAFARVPPHNPPSMAHPKHSIMLFAPAGRRANGYLDVSRFVVQGSRGSLIGLVSQSYGQGKALTFPAELHEELAFWWISVASHQRHPLFC
jgi:hypothetical protein